VRTQAEQQLNTLELSDLPNYLLALCRELGDPAKTSQTRQLAGIQLKNAIFSKDAARNAELTQRWLMVNDAVRLQIKHGILSTLASPVRESRSTAALVVGKLAAIEVPKKMWEDLVQLLLHNITAAPTKDLKQSTFEALGYVCEEVPESLSAHSNGILSAVASGMSAEETDANVKLAATNALTNSLLFIKDNMAVENDRRLIVQMIGTAAQFSDERVRVSAYQCLCDFADQYYEYLEPFMNDLFMLTGNAIKTECEAVALQALEFWTRIGEMESELVADEQDAQEKGRQPEQRCFKIVHRALLPLLPLILDCLMLQVFFDLFSAFSFHSSFYFTWIILFSKFSLTTRMMRTPPRRPLPAAAWSNCRELSATTLSAPARPCCRSSKAAFRARIGASARPRPWRSDRSWRVRVWRPCLALCRLPLV
jgi:importin subunit beta-1